MFIPRIERLGTATISGRAVEAVVVIEMGLVMPDGLPVMDMDNIVFKSLFGFCFWVLFLVFAYRAIGIGFQLFKK